MKNERSVAPETGYTEAELEALGDFSTAQRDGKDPDIEEYLRRVPGSAERLRPMLETVVRLCAEVEQLRTKHPGVDLVRLLDPNRRPKEG
jgi:hypothetical protein